MGERFYLRTFGCQMNQHDTEKISNLLHHAGLRPAHGVEEAAVVLIQTCSIREKAEQKLYNELGALSQLKAARPDLILGVGGCVAQQEGARLLARFPKVDFVFGPQNLRHVPSMVRAARLRERNLRVDYEANRLARFDLPERHPDLRSPTPGRAFVTVMEGCDLFCTFCVVPATRGREVSRPAQDILEEIRRHAGRGGIEVVLLGQTVNAYGRPRPGQTQGECSFAELIRRAAGTPGIERVRFTSPHPIFVSDELAQAYAEIPELCPHLHLPAQSGSSRMLRAMNRRHDRDDYLRVVERLRRARPDLAITTDLIVGFCGETEQDFEQTLSFVAEVGFVDSFSFKYSPRPGTPAVRRGLKPVDPEEAQVRLERLQSLQRELTLRAQAARVGTRTQILVEGPSRHPGQWMGRCPYHRVVNVAGESVPTQRLVEVDVVGATPHSLLGEPVRVSQARALPLYGSERREGPS
jgi:tRNA-2-methylthio-N6-dimethylallyladenosine synthase